MSESRHILHPSLYGSSATQDFVKNRLTAEIIESGHSGPQDVLGGEESLGVHKMGFGGVIVTTAEVGVPFCNAFNLRQYQHIVGGTMAHKMLCELREEGSALLFLTLEDFVGQHDFHEMDREALCALVSANLCHVIEERLPWVIKYSEYVMEHYYNMPTNRLKIRPNFILDDGIFDTAAAGKKQKGGLLLNGLLAELETYTEEWEPYVRQPIGMLCQVLSPNGLPRNKKWIQIDVGISFTGKRQYQEHIVRGTIRQAEKNIHVRVHPNVISTSMLNSKLYYGNMPEIGGYEGYEVYIWEVLYNDQIELVDEEPLKSECMCAARGRIIADNFSARHGAPYHGRGNRR